MKVQLAALLLFLLSAGAASASPHPSLRALSMSPPTFRGSGFGPHEHVTVSFRGVRVRPVRVVTNALGRFRVRVAALPACAAWTVRAAGVSGGAAIYRHFRCISAAADVVGIVKRGPTTPVCAASTPCYGPAAGVTVQAFGAGKLVAQTTTDSKGHFTFSLGDGYYTIHVLARHAETRTVHAARSAVVHLTLLIDTGIR